MRKITSVLIVLALVLLSSTALAQPGECTPGGVFRDQNGDMIDCLEETGDNCLACTFIVK